MNRPSNVIVLFCWLAALAGSTVVAGVAGAGAGEAEMERSASIRFQPEFATNFLMHLFAVGEIGFTSDYAAQHRHTVAPADLALLQRHRDLLAFGNGLSGPLTFTFFFLPAWLALPDAEHIDRYFSLLCAGLAQNDYQDLFAHYPVDWQDEFLAQSQGLFQLPEATWREVVLPLLPTTEALAAVFRGAASRYADEVWPAVAHDLQARADHLDGLFQDRDLIPLWERLTGATFGRDYTIVLCLANRNGPDANTLSFDRNVFYSGADDRRFLDFVSHEIGTHLLHGQLADEMAARSTSQQEFQRLYAAFESLAMFYNRIVLGREDLAYDLAQFDAARWLETYGKLHEPDVSARELFLRAIAQAP